MVRKNEECNTLIGSTKTSKMYRTSETQYQSLEVKEENSLQSCDCCFFTRSVIKDITKCLSEIPDYKTGPDGPETSPGNYSILARWGAYILYIKQIKKKKLRKKGKPTRNLVMLFSKFWWYNLFDGELFELENWNLA